MKVTRFRDLTLIEWREEKILLACDSIGGIGAKEADLIKVDEEIVGYFLCRVPLMELFAQGVAPAAVVLTFSNEWTPTGEGIHRGVQKALREAGVELVSAINGSTEENITTVQTGAGITIFGVTAHDFSFRTSPEGAFVVALGIPKVGYDVLTDEGEIVPMALVSQLRRQPWIDEILPVGSKGCLYEARQLAMTSGLRFVPGDSLPPWAEESAGPACVVLVALNDPDALVDCKIPVTILGTLELPEEKEK